MAYAGIDYGMGQTNVDKATGIRYGVIHHATVGEAWYESNDAEYGEPTCPACGEEVAPPTDEECDTFDRYQERGCDDYACQSCRHILDSSDVTPDEPLGYTFDDGDTVAEQSADDCDIFVTRSPYYTRAVFCSPCAPGACHLESPCDDGPKVYCFGPDWFSEEHPCPYKVYRVSDDSLVYAPAAE